MHHWRHIHGCVQNQQKLTMEITCPNCGIKLELPAGVQEGRHLRCSVCDKKFLYDSQPKIQLKIYAQAATKMPLPTKVACVIFYFCYIIGAIDGLIKLLYRPSGVVISVATLVLQIYVISLINAVRKRQNKSRIALTLANALIILVAAAFCIAAKAGMISAPGIVFLAIPLILLWLPASNRWFCPDLYPDSNISEKPSQLLLTTRAVLKHFKALAPLSFKCLSPDQLLKLLIVITILISAIVIAYILRPARYSLGSDHSVLDHQTGSRFYRNGTEVTIDGKTIDHNLPTLEELNAKLKHQK